MYKVLVEFNKDDYKTYEFDDFESAKEIYLHAKSKGLNVLIIDKSGNIISLK